MVTISFLSFGNSNERNRLVFFRSIIKLFCCLLLALSCGKKIPITNIAISSERIQLLVGEETQLATIITPPDATVNSVIWESSDASIAKVDENGKVLALKSGQTTISASVGGKSAVCLVTVIVPVERIKLNKTRLVLHKGASDVLIASVSPNDATHQEIYWTSSDPSVASVDKTGRVIALKGGEAVITAAVDGISENCLITVIADVESIVLNHTELALNKGASEVLVATVFPEDASDRVVCWTSSNASVAAVDDTGKVTALKGGQSIITAEAGGVFAECSVTVVADVESIVLNCTELTIKKGLSQRLIATVSPDDASDKTVTWTSSDISIASVDESGDVTANKGGCATISAVAGGLSAECVVTVVVDVESICLNKTELMLKKGLSERLIVSIR